MQYTFFLFFWAEKYAPHTIFRAGLNKVLENNATATRINAKLRIHI